jgi:hypothetical protein
MKRIFLCLCIISPFILCSQNLIAQTIKAGIWTGTITDPDGKTSEVKYDVKIIGDALSIVMKSKTMGDYPLDDIDLGKAKLSFSFFTGSLINCSLDMRTNGSYSGRCKGTDGTSWTITMIPSKD